MSTLIGLYLAPDGFHVVHSNGGLTFQIKEGSISSGILDTVLEDRYLIFKELIGQKISSNYTTSSQYVKIKVKGKIYRMEFDESLQKRIFKRESDGHILAMGSPEWTFNQSMAQKHGTLSIFTIHCTCNTVYALPYRLLTKAIVYVSGDINNGKDCVYEYDIFVSRQNCQEFCKILSEKGISIVKQILVQALFEKLL